ncbi:hypothetical protein A0H81_06286 [Grifola frondosa]|uniref:Uncharacterized protein n=1 Tax=Grifola frondosa TaxID=5627 RepID=A0A1C7MB45_GRIFR|nr:hypothetical protein A0H81_06286 [Grifola frondosa]
MYAQRVEDHNRKLVQRLETEISERSTSKDKIYVNLDEAPFIGNTLYGILFAHSSHSFSNSSLRTFIFQLVLEIIAASMPPR